MAEDNRISRNVSCISCGYNLRGLKRSGECSECGGAVAESLRPQRLLFADYGWLRRTARASTVLAVSSAGLLVALLLFVLATLVPLVGRGGGMRASTVFLIAFATVGLFTLLMAVIFVVGVWWVTVAEEAGAAGRISGQKRWLPRAASLFAVVSILLAFVLEDAQAGSAFLISAFGFLVVIVSCCGYMAAVIDRLPGSNHARTLRWRGRGLLYLGGVFMCLLPTMFSFSSPPYWLGAVFGILGFVCFAALALTLAGIMSCRRPLKQVLSAAGTLDELR